MPNNVLEYYSSYYSKYLGGPYNAVELHMRLFVTNSKYVYESYLMCRTMHLSTRTQEYIGGPYNAVELIAVICDKRKYIYESYL